MLKQLRYLGCGEFCSVWGATLDEAPVAVKVLKNEHVNNQLALKDLESMSANDFPPGLYNLVMELRADALRAALLRYDGGVNAGGVAGIYDDEKANRAVLLRIFLDHPEHQTHFLDYLGDGSERALAAARLGLMRPTHA